MDKKTQTLAGTVVGLALAAALSGCNDKATEQFKDAPVSARDKSAAEVYDMPDGFSNFAEKCDLHGNRVVIVFHNNGAYAGVAVVADPTCG